MQAISLHEHSHQQSALRRRQRRWMVFVLIGVALLCLPLVLGAGITTWALKGVYTSLRQAEAAADVQDVTAARAALERAQIGLERAETGSKMLLFWRIVPGVRRYVFTLDEGAAAARSTLTGVRELLDVADVIQQAFGQVGMGAQVIQGTLQQNRSFKDLSKEEKRLILERLSQVLPAIRQAREQMNVALARWQAVPRDGIAEPLRHQIDARVEQFEAIQRQFDEALKLAEVFLPMTGHPVPKKYLVILQNNQEMRGTGGFIGTVGEVWVDSGNVEKMVFQDVYSIDNPVSGVWKNPSPAPIVRWLEQPNLFLRDANWSPDFPTTANTLLAQYEKQRELAGVPVPRLDGIIAFEPDFFKRILEIIGPVQVEDQEFRADNFFDALQYDVHMRFHQNGVPTAQRKEVVAKLGDAVFQRVTSVPIRQWSQLLDAVTISFAQKDVMLYMRDPALQAAIDARDWSGRFESAPADYLAVIDANMGALKTDGVMDKRILYGLDASRPDEVRATVTLRYRNTNPMPNWRYTRYRTYTRVYVPEGSELLSWTGVMDDDLSRHEGRFVPGRVDVYRELGKTVFGGFFAVESGKTAEMQFTYRLPTEVARAIHAGNYELLVQKQPGSYAQFVMDGRFPRVLRRATPAEEAKRFGDAAYQQAIALERDTRILIQW